MPSQESSDGIVEPLLASREPHADAGDRVEANGGEAGALLDPEAPWGDKHEAHTAKLTGWRLTMCILLADMLGLGALTLPGDLAALGWLTGLGMVVLCAVGMLYTGVLFTRMATSLPRTGRFDAYAHAAFGRTGRILAYLVVYSCIAVEPIAFQVTCVDSLKAMLAHATGGAAWVSNASVGAIMALLMLPLAQVHGLEEVGWVSIIGTVGMLVAVLVVVVKLALLPGPHPATSALLPSQSSFNERIIAVCDIVFAYGGQINWTRYLSGMRHQSHFRRSVAGAGALMTAVFVLVSAVGYQRLGYDFDHTVPITAVLAPDVWSAAANIGVLVHSIVAYQIMLNVFAALVLSCTAPDALLYPRRARSRALWLLVTSAGIGYSFGVAWLLPFFSTVLAVIASIGDVSGSYCLPAAINLKLFRHRMPKWEVALCTFLVPATAALTCVGLYASVIKLAEQSGGGALANLSALLAAGNGA